MRKDEVTREGIGDGAATSGVAAAPPAEGVPPAEVKTRLRRLTAMMAALTILLVIGQLMRSAGSTLSPVLSADAGLKPEALAQVIGAMFLAVGLSQLPVGVLLDRFGPRRTIACATLIAALGCVVFASAPGLYGMILGRILIGAGISSTVMGGYLLVIRWAPREKFSTYSGLILFIGALGGILATTPLTLLLNAVGWRSAFAGIGAVVVIGAVLTFLLVQDAPAEVAPAGKKPTLREVTGDLLTVLKFRHLWPVLAVGPILYTPQQILLGLWAGPFLEDVYSLDAVARSHVLLAMSCGISIGMLLVGPVERLFSNQKVLVLTSMLALSAMFLALALVAERSLVAVVILLSAISLISPFYISLTAHAQTLQPGQYSGRVLSLLNMTSILGVFLSQNVTGSMAAAFPSATGNAAPAAYQAIFILMMAMFLVGTLIYRTVRA
jgi:predicted MFS family arabinose efflux permease